MKAARPSLLLLTLALVLGPVSARSEPVAVIVGAHVQLNEVSLLTLHRIYLGKLRRLGGALVEPLHLQSGTASRRTFGRVVLGRSEEELHDYWVRQALSGGRVPPRELSSVADVLREVARHPGAVGYVPVSALSAVTGVRILRLAGPRGALAPTDPGYPIATPPAPEQTEEATEALVPDKALP